MVSLVLLVQRPTKAHSFGLRGYEAILSVTQSYDCPQFFHLIFLQSLLWELLRATVTGEPNVAGRGNGCSYLTVQSIHVDTVY